MSSHTDVFSAATALGAIERIADRIGVPRAADHLWRNGREERTRASWG